MFLLPFLVFGLVLTVVLGGRLSRLARVPFRLGWTVFLALSLQVVLFTDVGSGLGGELRNGVHIGTYALLAVFAVANLRLLALAPVLLGMALNAAAIIANGGKMPISDVAAREVGLDPAATANVSAHADRLAFLGDIFAIPSVIPLANVFSVGDILIGVGVVSFLVYIGLSDGAEPELSPRRFVQPLRLSPFRRLVAGKFVSQVGDWLTLAALIGWLYNETGATEHIAALLLVRLAPPIVGSGIAALLIDRLPKRGLLVWIEAGRGCAVVVAIVGLLGGNLPAIYGALAVSAALAALSAAAVPALVPALIPTDQLPAANAALGMAKDAAMALGALGAGIALSTSGAAVALVVDLVTFGVAMALYLGLRVPGGDRRAREDTRVGALRYVLGRRPLVVIIFAFATATLATGLTNVSLPRFLDGQTGLGPGGYGFGLAALSIGLLSGEALVGFSRVGAAAGRWIGAGLLIMAGLFGVLGLVEHAPTALLLLAFIGFVDGTTDVVFETVAQRETDPRYYGAVFGFASALMASTMTAAFLVAPVVNRLADPSVVILGAGAVLAVAGAIALVGMPRARASADAPVVGPMLPEPPRAQVGVSGS